MTSFIEPPSLALLFSEANLEEHDVTGPEARRFMARHNMVQGSAPLLFGGFIYEPVRELPMRYLSRDEILLTSQTHFNVSILNHYVQHQPEGSYRPITCTYRGTLWIAEGHHRILASRLRGDDGLFTVDYGSVN